MEEIPIQIVLLKNPYDTYLIARIEERDVAPECLLHNPYKLVEETHWTYSKEDTHNPSDNTIFLGSKEELEIRNGNENLITQHDYLLFQKFPLHTKQTQIYLRADDILTLYDPSYEILEYYRKLTE